MTILTKIRDAKESFRSDSIRIAEGYDFNQYKTIRQVELYFNSRYLTGEFDEDGFKKPFFNIVRKPCLVASKEIDLDTKDIIIRSQNGDYLAADIMSMELKQWMKDEGFAKKLNEYADLAPVYGSVVVKKVGEELHTVDLKNLTVEDPTAKTLDHTGVIESHQVTPDELRKMADKGGWDKDKVEEVIELYAKRGKPLITIDERYGWVKGDEVEGGKEGELVYTLAIVGGSEETEESPDKKSVVEAGIVIFHAPIDTHPYKEWHWMKMPNRWLGVGLVEIAFDAQIRRNETAYLKSKALLWSSLQLFQTDDENIAGGNMLTDMKNGDILKLQPNKSVVPVNTAERNLAHYNAEEIVWERNAQDLTFSSDIIGGESLPSGTPARSAILQDQNVKRFFDRKREDFGLFIKDIIEKDILPSFLKKKRASHVLSVAGSLEDRERIEKLILDTRTVAAFQKHTEKGTLPSLNEWNRLVATEAQRVSQARTLDIELPDGYYQNLEQRIEVVITKENEDTDSRIAGTRAVLEVLGANPAIATSPITRPIFLELAHLLGVKNLNIPTTAGQPVQAPEVPQGAPPQAGPLPVENDVLQAIPT